MNLDSDLQRILNIGAKVYHTLDSKQGKVYSNNGVDIMVDYGKGKYETYKMDEFAELLTSDVIVANSRVTQGNGESFKIKPREKSALTQAFDVILGDTFQYQSKPEVKDIKQDSNRTPYEIGYINFPTGRFSTEPKKGYTKVEFRKAVEKVTLEVDSEMLEKLREMGLV
jgi:hypothetical protein